VTVTAELLAHPLSAERLGGPAPDRISVDEAMDRIVHAFSPLEDYERLAARRALGRVLVEDIPADGNVPPFTNVAVDGYAVRAEDVEMATRNRPVAVRVLGEVLAGQPVRREIGRGEAYRVLTGAPLPPGADAVVPYEDTDGTGFGGWSGEVGARAAIMETGVRVFRAADLWANIRFAGEDQHKGEVVLRAGTIVSPAVVGSLATLGRTRVWVRRRPRVAILSTGNELVPASCTDATSDAPGTNGRSTGRNASLGAAKIRDANGHSLAALVERYGGEVIELGIAGDDPGAVVERLDAARERGADLLLTSGGVSMGDHDPVKVVLCEHGVVDFWSIDIRPGRPLTFGAFRDTPIIALPGNPVAVMVTFELFVRPALLRLAGHTRWRKVVVQATALQAISNRSGRENFLRGVLEQRELENGTLEWAVRLTGEQGSGILTSMVKANGLVRLVRGQNRVEAGDRVPVFVLDWEPLW
jgi:molybdopterin molybdotransferase